MSDYNKQLASDIAGFYDDPLGFVLYAYPWGQAGTALEHYNGPDAWQVEILTTLSTEIKARKFDGKTPVLPIQIAVSSGHGVGKSTLVAWLIQFIMSTRPKCRGVITSGTYAQLQDKTFAELGKWHYLSIVKHWFNYNNNRGALSYEQKENKTAWNVKGVASSEHKSDDFAGLHCAHSSPFIIFDEASAVPEAVFSVAKGAMTDGEPFFILTGNATRTTGGFIDALTSGKGNWITRCIDSRQSRMANKGLIAQWLDEMGEDSDFFRVRVRGLPPNAATNQLIPFNVVQDARKTRLHPDDYQYQPIVIGVDVARGGQDESVICVRQGRKVILLKPYVGLDNVQLAQRVAEIYRSLDGVQGLFVDESGLGAGCVDYLKHTGYPVIGVMGGTTADNDKMYFNRRAEMWVKVLNWLTAGQVEIPDDPQLALQLTSQEYFFDKKDRYQMLSKDNAKSVGFSSPDRADALCMTFGYAVSYAQTANSFEPPGYD